MSLPLSFRIFLRILSQKFFFRNSSSSLAPVRVAVKTFTCFLSLLPSFGQSQKTKEEEDPKRRKKSRSPARLSPPVLFPGKQERAIFLDLIALLHPSLLPRGRTDEANCLSFFLVLLRSLLICLCRPSVPRPFLRCGIDRLEFFFSFIPTVYALTSSALCRNFRLINRIWRMFYFGLFFLSPVLPRD